MNVYNKLDGCLKGVITGTKEQELKQLYKKRDKIYKRVPYCFSFYGLCFSNLFLSEEINSKLWVPLNKVIGYISLIMLAYYINQLRLVNDKIVLLKSGLEKKLEEESLNGLLG